jgi:hypothetical protein
MPELDEPDIPDPVVFFIMSGCAFIHDMHFVSLFIALSDMPWHRFIVAWSLDDIESLAANAVPAENVINIAIASFFIVYSLSLCGCASPLGQW